jgi:hypothetical protein
MKQGICKSGTGPRNVPDLHFSVPIFLPPRTMNEARKSKSLEQDPDMFRICIFHVGVNEMQEDANPEQDPDMFRICIFRVPTCISQGLA